MGRLPGPAQHRTVCLESTVQSPSHKHTPGAHRPKCMFRVVLASCQAPLWEEAVSVVRVFFFFFHSAKVIARGKLPGHQWELQAACQAGGPEACAPPTAALGGRPAWPRVTAPLASPRASPGVGHAAIEFGQSHAPPQELALVGSVRVQKYGEVTLIPVSKY